MNTFPVLRHLLAALAALLCSLPATAMQQAFLVQNSGWMEPFYADRESLLKPLVEAVVRTVAAPDDAVVISAFSQNSALSPSPQPLYRGKGPGSPANVLAPLELARKSASALADTDFREAVVSTIERQFSGKSGIVWIFTNNRNSPNNNPQTAERNREFYRLVHAEPAITRVLAFPLRMPVRGRHYQATGLMVYAMAYGQEAAVHLEKLLASGQIGRVFTEPPARLKPLDQDAVTIRPASVENSANITASVAPDGRTLVFDVEVSSLLPRISLQADFINRFHPYDIRAARVEATLRTHGQQLPVAVSPAQIRNLGPGAPAAVRLEIPVPPALVPSPWSAEAFRAMGKSVQLAARLDITLADQTLAPSEAFRAAMRRDFPSDPLPEMFVPPASIKHSQDQIPIVIRIHYPLTPVLLTLGAGFALLALLGALAWFVRGKPSFAVIVDGTRRRLPVRAFSEAPVYTAEGLLAGRIRRRLGKPTVAHTESGHTLHIPGR